MRDGRVAVVCCKCRQADCEDHVLPLHQPERGVAARRPTELVGRRLGQRSRDAGHSNTAEQGRPGSPHPDPNHELLDEPVHEHQLQHDPGADAPAPEHAVRDHAPHLAALPCRRVQTQPLDPRPKRLNRVREAPDGERQQQQLEKRWRLPETREHLLPGIALEHHRSMDGRTLCGLHDVIRHRAARS